MKTIIIEDEKHQQELLLKMLQENFPFINCMGIAESVDEGISLINSVNPELVFLDVMLGNQTCFELLSYYDSRNFEIIFTTSYDEYAIKAFRLAAIDYLLKPIDLTEISSAVEKVMKKKLDHQSLDHIKLLLSNIKNDPTECPKVAVPTLNGFIVVKVEDIMRCESDNTYTTLFLRNGKSILISKTLKTCEQMFSDYSFIRVHNSNLINPQYVREYIKGEGGSIIMEDGTEVLVSRRKKEEFLRYFNNLKL